MTFYYATYGQADVTIIHAGVNRFPFGAHAFRLLNDASMKRIEINTNDPAVVTLFNCRVKLLFVAQSTDTIALRVIAY